MKQRLFVDSGALPSDVGREDYFELLEILKAKPRDKRPVTAHDAFRKLRGD
ncbi:hypothetical protein [Liquorilactobacillus capillatus]|uniref:Uncharacterized protein n=1 Tax=Liquorilactobacillus capillatus DSM 19910 TaxID=1423731 RepID=A0A0R1M3B6_9LACO|nr:hypothetical protein [Liquorilactobacillus capillatus]KRL02524.1 hypothetical protein FC81_GL000692 [Liquorilactobacillus capillatus DSM 19910]